MTTASLNTLISRHPPSLSSPSSACFHLLVPTNRSRSSVIIFLFAGKGLNQTRWGLNTRKNAVGLTETAAGEVKVTLTVPESETAFKKSLLKWLFAVFFPLSCFPFWLSPALSLCYDSSEDPHVLLKLDHVYQVRAVFLFLHRFCCLAASQQTSPAHSFCSWQRALIGRLCLNLNLDITVLLPTYQRPSLEYIISPLRTKEKLTQFPQSKTVLLLETWAALIKW